MALANDPLPGRLLMVGAFLPLLLLGGIGFGLWLGWRNLFGDQAQAVDPIEPAEAFKSFAIAAAMFLAFIALSVGVIDLLQAASGGSRLAGSNSDLARGLSLIIVGAPVHALLLRLTIKRHEARAALGDRRPHRGWSAYVVAALSVSLIGVLISAGQILNDAFNSSASEIDNEEVAQLIGWLLMWVLHWFLLRPRFGIRGSVHLVVGSVAGLGWLVSGVAGTASLALQRAYDASFDRTLIEHSSIRLWICTLAIGAVVWAWHWVLHLNRTDEQSASQRRSPGWHFVAIGAAIVPAIIVGFVAVTGATIGVLIWFFGSTNSDAVDYFEGAPQILTAVLLAIAAWAYHRWELLRDGPVEREEPIRFHDYAVAAVGLTGVVVGIAMVVNLFIEAVFTGDVLATGTRLDNSLIVACSVIVFSSALWWVVWSGIERERHRAPVDESDSFWRKFYLTVTAGLGGLMLASMLVWILFVFLRDLLDGGLGRASINELRSPIGTATAVVGAVWYHLGVWRSDRGVLAERTAALAALPAPPREASVVPASPVLPAPPRPVSAPVRTTTPNGLALRTATPADHGEIFTIQRAAFVDEGVAYGTPITPALVESFDEFQARVGASHTIVAVSGHRIVGSVSVRNYRPGGPDIERLMVVPDRRRDGIARQLLAAVEHQLAAEGHDAVQLVVGEIVTPARTLYDQMGYEFVSRHQEPGGPALLTVRKQLRAH